MRREFSLSGTGFGLFLIAIGLAAISDLTLKTNSLGMVWRCYPALPIFLGLDFILSQTWPVTKTVSWVHPAGWIATLIIVITMAGLITGVVPTLFSNEFKQLGLTGFTPRLPLESNCNYRQTLREDFQIPPGVTVIRIENEFGDLWVDSGNAKTVSATARIKYAFQPPKAESGLQQVKLLGRVQDGTFLIQLEHPRHDNGFLPQFMAVMAVKVPPGMAVEVKNSFGKVTIGEIHGKLMVDNSNGRIKIKKVYGETTITSRLSPVNIGEIDGSLVLDSTAGPVKIRRVRKNLTLHHDFGNLKLGEVSGELNLTGKNAQIDIFKVSGKIRLENSFGNVHIREALDSVTAEVSNGQLNMGVNRLNGPIDLRVQFGNVDLKLPKKAAYTLQAQTSFGRINSEVSVTRGQENGIESVTGNINGGGPLVSIETRNGNITVKTDH